MTAETRALRLGTRGSALALAQSRQVADAITAATGIRVELVPITSAGDVTRASLAVIGGTGVFATALRDALAAGECDLLVHSLKDLPTLPAPGLVVAAVPPRADPRDVVVTRDGTPLADLAGVVGTGSPRRVAQVRRANPGVGVADLRGNVDSRLGRVRAGELDAVVLAAAGLDRLGLAAGAPVPADLAVERLALEHWPTAPGQGALAIEVREDDAENRAAVASLEDAATRAAVEAERAVLAELEAGCHAPVGAAAATIDGALRVRAVVYALDGSGALAAELSDDSGTETADPASGRGRRAASASDEPPARPADGRYAGRSGSGNGAHAAHETDPIARARRVGSLVARRLLAEGAAGLVER